MAEITEHRTLSTTYYTIYSCTRLCVSVCVFDNLISIPFAFITLCVIFHLSIKDWYTYGDGVVSSDTTLVGDCTVYLVHVCKQVARSNTL